MRYTNAATIVSEDFRDTEDLDGLFSGLGSRDAHLRPRVLAVRGHGGGGGVGPARAGRAHGPGRPRRPRRRARAGRAAAPATRRLQHPRCVYQLLRRHFARYTPELVEETCGVSREQLPRGVRGAVRELRPRAHERPLLRRRLDPAHGRRAVHPHRLDHPAAAGQHRAPGRRHPRPARPRVDPGLDRHPDALRHPARLPADARGARRTRSLEDYIEQNSPPAGYWANMGAYTVSLLKAWWGDAATAENDFCFDHLPRLTGDHSYYSTLAGMVDGTVKGLFVMGENPTVGAANGAYNRAALRGLDWLVVRDLVEIETAAFWYDAPGDRERRGRARRTSRTEVFLLPGASHVEKKGTFTNTQRLLQWREQAVEPRGDCRSELWFMYHLGRRVREKLAGSSAPRDRAVLELTWDYPTEGAHDDPDAEAVLREIGGVDLTTGKEVPDYLPLKDDGSTACGCWIYAGCYAGGVNQVARRKPGREQSWVAPEWGWAWPMNRRILYNRASADPEGKPWSERKRYLWWDRRAGQVDGRGHPGLQGRHGARLRAARGRPGPRRAARRRAVHHAGRRQGVALRARRPGRRPAAHALRAARVAVRQPALRRRSSPTRRASRSAAPRTRTTPPTASPASTSSPTWRPPTGSPSTTPRAGCRAGCPTWPSCSPRCSARSRPRSRASAASSTAAG